MLPFYIHALLFHPEFDLQANLLALFIVLGSLIAYCMLNWAA
jgi:cytochrome c biogenesis factor